MLRSIALSLGFCLLVGFLMINAYIYSPLLGFPIFIWISVFSDLKYDQISEWCTAALMFVYTSAAHDPVFSGFQSSLVCCSKQALWFWVEFGNVHLKSTIFTNLQWELFINLFSRREPLTSPTVSHPNKSPSLMFESKTAINISIVIVLFL